MAASRMRWSPNQNGGGGKAGAILHLPAGALSCMPPTCPAVSEPRIDATDFACFPYDDQAKSRLQEFLVGPRMRKSAPIYTPIKPDSRWCIKGGFFVRMEVLDTGAWYGRGSSKKIAESSAAISGLIDLGVDTLEQHSDRPAVEIAKAAPVPPKCIRQYAYDDQAKCRLQEFVVGRLMRLPAPKYTVHSTSGSKNNPLFVVKMDIQNGVGTWFGSGPNKKHAECSAALAALIDLRVDELDQRVRKSECHINVASVREAL
jgi:dsRNA-specific ribonuclease